MQITMNMRVIMDNRRQTYYVLFIVLVCAAGITLVAAQQSPPLKPFVISGSTFYTNDTSCSNPDLNITNLNTNKNWTTGVSENYYRLLLCSDNVSTGDLLRFDVSSDKVSETFNHTLTVDEMDVVRLFYNITLSINSPPKILSYSPKTSIHNLEGVLKTFNITTDQIVNVTWFENGKEVDKDTSTTEASCTLAANETGAITASASNPNGTVNQTWFWRVVNQSPKLPLFIVSGFATYVNGGASRKFTMNVTNLNTSTTWQADTRSGSNYYRLIIDYGEFHPGDMLKFTARNMDAGTVNTSEYTLSPADQLNVRYNVTFDSVDVTVLVLDSNRTVHYQFLFLNHEPDFIVLNATEIACDFLNLTFESSGSTVTRIDGIENPVVHLYDAQADAWEEVTPDHCLTNEDVIIWSNATAELPELRSDLSITGIAITDCWGTTPHSNITNTVNVTILNRGYIASDLSDVVLSGNGEMIDGRILPRIDPMTVANITFEWVPEKVGNYTIAIVVDPYNLIPELDEDNNSRSQKVVVERGTVIRVPHDYQTVLEDLPNVTAYSIVYVDDGVYISYGYLDKHTPAMQIKDTHHIKIIGNSHDASMLHLSARVNQPGHDVIRIVNSSDIELRGFTVEARYRYCSENGPENIRVIAVKDSRNISLLDLKLIHGGDPRYDNTVMKIENSECVTIAGNHISGTSGNSGIYSIGLNNSTIRYNSVCRIGAAISLNGNNNNIHSNNFFGGGGSSGNNNHWNASNLVNYTFKGRNLANYIGNYWHGYDSSWIVDQDGDGIWDTPKSLGGTATDYHPLVQPYGEVYSLRVKSISVPYRIYTGINNTIITVIRQDSVLTKGVGVFFRTNVGPPIGYKEVSMSATEEAILKYVWTPNEINFSEIYVSASVDDSITSFQAREEMPITVSDLPYNCRDNITDALLFLRCKQTPSSGSIGSFSTSTWAILAFSASGEDTDVKSKYGRSISGYLASHPALPGNEFVLVTLEDLARTSLAVSALGGDPTNFGGVNYLTMVKSYHDCIQFDDPASVTDDAFGILALVAFGDPNATKMIDQSRNYIVSNQNRDGGWSKIIEDSASNATDGNATNTTFTITSDLRTTSLVIQALVAAGEPPNSGIITNASALLRRNLGYDGNFSNAITTAYAIQAIVAIGENPSEWRNVSLNDSKSPIDYLLSLQQPDGSFNYTKDTAFFPIDITAKVIPALAASPLPVRLGSADAYPLPEITPFGYIYTPEVIYVNTSCTVHGKLRCNGGMFNVSLLEDGVPAASTTVRSIWHDSDSEIPFSLEWTPSKDGLVDLTVFVDSSNRVEEAHEHNNNLSRNVFVNLPDLLISNVTLPDEIFVNATNIVSAGVYGITDEEFNVTFLADGIPVGRTWIRGIKDSANLSFEWRPNRTGNHTVSFVADSDGEVREECETNNATAVLAEVILPDLVPVNLTPRRAFVRARNDITVTINGTAERFNVTLIEGNTVVANATNITCYVQKSVNLTYKPQSLGIHNFTVAVDPDADILETNETNNNLTVTINVTRTDLVPIKVLPEIVYLNETSKVIVVVNGVAEGFNATLIAHARDFPNGTITIVNETGNMTNTTNTTNITNPMIVNATNLDTYNNGNLTIKWRPYFQGWHNMTAIVDSDNNVNETNETNNNLTAEVFTANRIQLELVSPRGGEICGGIHPIKWKALHDKNLTINLSYSPNYGINWIPLASNLTCDPALTANLTENLVQNATNATNTTNATNITGGDYNGVYLWNTGDLSDGEYLIRITARWYILEEMYTSNTIIVLNGDAASGGIGGNARYFDWDTPDEPCLAWASEDIFAGGSTSIVVADDRVFVYCTGGGGFRSSEYTYMVALNATNGEMLWATKIDSAVYGSWASPAYHNGSIFVASGQQVFRIDGETGAIWWVYTFTDGGDNVNGGPSIAGGKVFVASYGGGGIDGGKMFCLDEETGEEIWNTSSYLKSVTHLGSPTPKYGRIYYGRGYDVYCLTIADGTVVWNTSLQKDVYSTPVVVDGKCYVATYEFGQGYGGFNCLDAFNGSILWNVPVERTDSTPAYFAPRDSDKKYIYVVGGCSGASDYAVYCFNATNGSLLWTNEDAGSWTNSAAVSRDAKVFVGVSVDTFNYNGLKCFDAYTGDELWSAPYGGSSPYIAYGRVYTIGGNRVYAFGQRELPDLVVTAASASGGVVRATIRNIGTGGTNESFRVALRQSGSGIDKCTVGALDAGESVAVTLDPHGECEENLEVYADSGYDIPERNEYNNMREVWVPCVGGGSGGYGTKGDNDNPGNGDGNTNDGGPGSGGGTGGFVGGGGYWNYYHVGAGADDVETTTTTSTQTMVNETESQGTQHRVEGYPMGAELESGGGGGGYFSYAMILAGLILAGLLVHGIRKERGRYRRPTK
ncbi:MAG: hypothetical protein AEth_01699 [Candidatus Argoarchaeum ethanivorans]|uniref:Uncharacterized protein n=1 Tax=Candidatus Argoarchaeum ethanivorans TaxID=2608793 RepID=A0A8B3RZY3_9EURY|nr:MAG: hypothetical protein AEth_01699 [Candidatus Argoarchaeum ethanivorans]